MNFFVTEKTKSLPSLPWDERQLFRDTTQIDLFCKKAIHSYGLDGTGVRFYYPKRGFFRRLRGVFPTGLFVALHQPQLSEKKDPCSTRLIFALYYGIIAYFAQFVKSLCIFLPTFFYIVTLFVERKLSA